MGEDNGSKKNVSFRWDESNVEDFDEAVLRARLEDDDIGKGMSRSDVLRLLATEFIEEHSAGNTTARIATAN